MWIEWIECNLPWLGHDRDFQPREAFESSEMNQPGTLILVRDEGRDLLWLIGGSEGTRACDECLPFSDDAVVLQYKILWGSYSAEEFTDVD